MSGAFKRTGRGTKGGGGGEGGDEFELRRGWLDGEGDYISWLVVFITLVDFDFRWGVQTRGIGGGEGGGGASISICARKL